MNSNDEGKQRSQDERLGFGVEVSLLSGLSFFELLDYQRSLEDHLNEQGLQSSWTQLKGSVWDAERDLSLADQCDFLCWLSEQPGVAAAVVSGLRPVDGDAQVDGPQLRMTAYGVSCVAGRLLYRLGLLKPEEFARVLGGFVQPIPVE